MHFTLSGEAAVLKLLLLPSVKGSTLKIKRFYTPPHNSGGVLWFHVGRP